MNGLLGRLVPEEVLAGGVATVTSALERVAADPRHPPVVSGLVGAADALLLAAWFRRAGRPALVVAPTRDAALRLADDLEAWLGHESVVYLPQQEVMVFDRNSPAPELVGGMLSGLDRLRRDGPLLAVTSLYGLRQRVIHPDRLAASVIEVARGDRRDRDEFCEALARRGYTATGMVARTGDFARRGGLIDVFAPGELPLRLEFFDDEIVSLRHFDADSQRSRGECERARMLPVSHLILDDDAELAALGRVEEAALAGEMTADERADLDARIEERVHSAGLEAFLPLFGRTSALTDHLPADCAIFWSDPVQLGAQRELQDDETPRVREARLRHDPWLPEIEELLLAEADLAALDRPQVLLAPSWIAGDAEARWLGREAGPVTACGTRSPGVKGGDVGRLRDALLELEGQGQRVALLCANRGQADRLGELIDEAGEPPPMTVPAVGYVSGGFLWPDAGIACITEHEFFERYRRPVRPRFRGAGVVKDTGTLHPGEYVVHIEYGIALYRGLRRIPVEGSERECLLLEYAGDDRVYVPVEKIDLVERYSTDRDARPELSRLGGRAWARVTSKARKAIRAMAAELIDLYASRQVRSGHAFPPDGPLHRALAESFLFEETPDQRKAIAEVARDMESERPMDRLICGDVGYGKTEVAMRAAFKAVTEGRQVAVLCPTTLLASQHGATFAERFRDFPVRVRTLSRFLSPRDQKALLKQAAAGEVDVLIGTHRLFSRDVKLANLGLLVVDEEHRFGVRHKERIKELRSQVDVLTLSATPIPRTLYLALMGARDMSLINTPPRDRLPIQTELCAFSEEVLREAVMRELHRGGQVFFVHNRIETIEGMAALVRKLLPNVRVCVAHGRLKEDELEKVMGGFLEQEYDVLVTTVIIESGLDMPRVNTIIIDRADRFGLAQLYQLRGRVGRSNQRAFAYLMTPPGEALTLDARRRLAALEEFQALGSGYHIAMRDLEIRGAGNLLGEEQHGHMEAIGFDLYCRLLEEAAAEIRGGVAAARLDVKVDLRLPAFLPDEYIGDPEQKMYLYQRLSRLRDDPSFGRLREEIHDRYGPLPGPVENLVAVYRIRLLASRNGVAEIRAGAKNLSFFFAGGQEPPAPIIRGLMGTGPKGLMFKAVDQLIMMVPAGREDLPAAAFAMLDLLDRLREREAAGEAGAAAPAGTAGSTKERR